MVAEKGGDSVGGVRFKISNDKAKDIELWRNTLKGEKQYWIVTNDYIASGGDGMEIFKKRWSLSTVGKKSEM